MGNDKQNKKKTRRISVDILVTVAVLLIGASGFFGYRFISSMNSYNAAEEHYGEIRQMFEEDPTDDEAKILPEAETAEEKDTDPYDFDLLLAINPEAVGYIKARGEGDKLDYPLVQGTDNEFYLDHMFNGEPNSSGAIFVDAYAAEGLDGKYTIIYGHNMRSGAGMFRCLDNYRNEEYLKEHREVDVYIVKEKYLYTVFAVMETTTSGFVYDPNFEDNLTGNMEEVLESSIIDCGSSIEDLQDHPHVVCLSTCMTEGYAINRLVVFLVREKQIF